MPFLPVATLTLLLAASSFAAEYHALKEIPIGGAGSYDYLFADGANRRLYVSHGTVVVVLDLDKYSVVGEVADTPGIHGNRLAQMNRARQGVLHRGATKKSFDPPQPHRL